MAANGRRLIIRILESVTYGVAFLYSHNDFFHEVALYKFLIPIANTTTYTCAEEEKSIFIEQTHCQHFLEL